MILRIIGIIVAVCLSAIGLMAVLYNIFAWVKQLFGKVGSSPILVLPVVFTIFGMYMLFDLLPSHAHESLLRYRVRLVVFVLLTISELLLPMLKIVLQKINLHGDRESVTPNETRLN